MKRIVTQPQTLRFRYFFGAILFCTLMLNATQFKTKTFYINTNTESETTFLNNVAKNMNDVVNNREVTSEKILRNDITISPITAINSKFTKVSRVLSVKSALSKLFVFTGTGNWAKFCR